MQSLRSRRGLEIAPFRALRYSFANGVTPAAVTAPPYDVLSPDDHRRLLELSPHNITHLTLGEKPGGISSYEERKKLLDEWKQQGVLRQDVDPAFYVNVVDYAVPGSGRGSEATRQRFVGLVALGRLHPFEESVILPHERTFPKVVDDRLSLLDATRTNLESIFLLYSDPAGGIDRLLEAHTHGVPLLRVEARPGEFHEIHAVSDLALFIRLIVLLGSQKPIIADGHHRYTTSLRFWREGRERGEAVPGAGWQMMTFGNLRGGGLSILATHRLVKLHNGTPADALRLLANRFQAAAPEDADLRIETRERSLDVRFPAEIKASRRGVARTNYALLHDVVLGEWLREIADEEGIRYFKEGTGENDALARGEGDILFRMKPVDPLEFENVVQGGEVFPHKTTFFYPKLWSGLLLWPLEEPERLALK